MDSPVLSHRILCHHQGDQLDTDSQIHTLWSPEEMDSSQQDWVFNYYILLKVQFKMNILDPKTQ